MPGPTLNVAALVLCCIGIATAQTAGTNDGLPLERFESLLEAEEKMLLGGGGASVSSQAPSPLKSMPALSQADQSTFPSASEASVITAYQFIASREELSYMKLAIDSAGLQGIFNTTEKDLATYLLPSNDAFRTLLRAVNGGRQEPRGVNQSEFYLLRSLTKDPIVPFILVFNIFPNRRWTSRNMAAGKTMISKYNQFLVNIVEDVGAADTVNQNGKPPVMLETEGSPAPPARIAESDIDLLGPSVAHITDMVLLPPYIPEDQPAPTPTSAPESSQAEAQSDDPREPTTPTLECDDQQPSPEFTCAQQKAWGKCLAIWMVQGNFCRETCGACTPANTPQASSSENETANSTEGAPEAGAQQVTVTNVGPTKVTREDAEESSSRKLLEEGQQIQQPQPAGKGVLGKDQAAAAQRSLLLRSRFAGALKGLRGPQHTPRRGQMQQQQQQQQQRLQAAKPRQ